MKNANSRKGRSQKLAKKPEVHKTPDINKNIKMQEAQNATKPDMKKIHECNKIRSAKSFEMQNATRNAKKPEMQKTEMRKARDAERTRCKQPGVQSKQQ